MKKYIFFGIFVLCTIVTLSAQITSDFLYENYVFEKDVRSVELYRDGYPFSFPVIQLQSDEQLILSFDELGSRSRYLKYTFIHCSYDWKPDGLNAIEYLEGFMEDDISSSSFSFNTIQPYTHYVLAFPTDMMRPNISGNYILFVYDESPDNPILTRRFVVVENQMAEIRGMVKQASDVSDMFRKQEVDFYAHTGAWNVRNPAQYLHANIVQNGRWDNAVIGLRYRYGKPGEYSFDYDDGQNVFNGSSEFRTFDIKSLKYDGNHITSIGYEKQSHVAYLIEDMPRPFGPYVSGNTLNGRCYYKTEDFVEENREEYVYTTFTLKSDFPLTGGKCYVFGQLTDWKIQSDAQLHYNKQFDFWEATLYLKQGLYNYQYVWVPDHSNTIDETYIEGNHWETMNEYSVFLYLRDEGGTYDRLIGFTTLKLVH